MRLAFAAAAALTATLASAQFYGKYQEIPDIGTGRIAVNGAGTGVRVDQKLKDFVPMELPFKNENGQTVTLSKVLRGKPAILLPVFYECKGICTIEMNRLMDTLNGFKREKDWVGQGFDVICFSIDPSETPELAKDKELTYLELYRPNRTDRLPATAQEGFTFLTGSKENVAKLADSIGFRYRIESGKGNIVHPGALLVLTPQGQISKYFLGEAYPARILLQSLHDAAQQKIGERDDSPFFMSCINMDPLTGQVSVNIMNVLKTAGVATLLAVIGTILIWERRGRRTRDKFRGGKAGSGS